MALSAPACCVRKNISAPPLCKIPPTDANVDSTSSTPPPHSESSASWKAWAKSSSSLALLDISLEFSNAFSNLDTSS